MSGGFHVRPEDLDTGAARFRAVSDDLARAVAELHRSLGALGDVCGGDEQGRRFAAGYQPRADEGGRALDALARAVATVPDGLRRASADYRAADGSNGSALGGDR